MTNRVATLLTAAPLAIAMAGLLAACAPQASLATDSSTAGEIATTPPPSPEALATSRRAYAQLTHMLAQDDKCNWLDQPSRVAVEATAAERKAWLISHNDDPQQLDKYANDYLSKTPLEGCEGNLGQQTAAAIHLGAWRMRGTWLLRASEIASGDNSPAWMAGKSVLFAQREALNEARASLIEQQQIGGNALEGIRSESQQMLSLRCSDKDVDCPTELTTPALRTYAAAWLEQVERYGQAIKGREADLGSPEREAK